METHDKSLVAQIDERFLAELAGEPGIDPRLVAGLRRIAVAGQLSTETILLELYERLAADAP